jgi:hypothetical protein
MSGLKMPNRVTRLRQLPIRVYDDATYRQGLEYKALISPLVVGRSQKHYPATAISTAKIKQGKEEMVNNTLAIRYFFRRAPLGESGWIFII